MKKILLHIVKSKKKGVHSMHQELIDHPPVKYINSEPQKPANFSDVSKIDILVPVAKAVLNFTKIPNFWYVRKKADLIHSSGYCILNQVPWVVDVEHIAAFTGFNSNRLNSQMSKFLLRKSLESKYCKKIMTWSEASARSIRNYFNSDKINKKIEVVYPAIST